MGSRTNSTNRLAAITPIGSTYIFDISDFPAPISNIITLTPGNYIIANTVDLSGNTLKFDSVGEDLSIITLDIKRSSILCSSSATFLEVVNGRNIVMDDLAITLSGANVPFVDMNITGNFTMNFCSVNFTGGGTSSLGTMTKGGISFAQSTFMGFRNGISLDDPQALLIDGSFFVSDFLGVTQFFEIGKLAVAAGFTSTGIVGGANESIFNIDPTINPAGQVFISQFLNNGASTYFKAGLTGAITLFADASIGATAITSVTSGTSIPAGGNYARFNHAGTDVFVGQRVVNSTFTPEVTYNQTLIVTVTGAGFFEGNIESSDAPIAFTNDDTGSFLSNSVTVTSTGHPLGNLQPLAITDTVSYNGGFTIYNDQTNTFQINSAFFTGETVGNWDTGSLTQRDPRLDVQGNGDQIDSMVLAQGNLSTQQTSIITTTNFTISTIVSNGSGGSTVTTTAPHGYSDRRGIEIDATGNSNFDNNQYLIFNASGSVFDISEPFAGPAVVSGDVDTGQNVSEPVDGTAFVKNASTERFTITTTGRVFYTGLRPFSGSFGYNASVQKSGGGTDVIEGSIFLNGKKAEESISVTENSTITTIAKSILATFDPGDFLDVCFANNSGTSNILVEAQSEITASKN